jgi:hypothetical protein
VASGFAPHAHQPRSLQHSQMLRHRGPADGEALCDVSNGEGFLSQAFQNRSASRISQGLEDGGVSAHIGKPRLTDNGKSILTDQARASHHLGWGESHWM